jgi:hypothetical protein
MPVVNRRHQERRNVMPEKSEATKLEISQDRSIPEIVVYWDINFQGESWRTNLDYSYVGDHWNDQISSIIVVSGQWQFYVDAGYQYPEPNHPLGPNYYANVEAVGIKNDSISSFKCVALT